MPASFSGDRQKKDTTGGGTHLPDTTRRQVKKSHFSLNSFYAIQSLGKKSLFLVSLKRTRNLEKDLHISW